MERGFDEAAGMANLETAVGKKCLGLMQQTSDLVTSNDSAALPLTAGTTVAVCTPSTRAVCRQMGGSSSSVTGDEKHSLDDAVKRKIALKKEAAVKRRAEKSGARSFVSVSCSAAGLNSAVPNDMRDVSGANLSSRDQSPAPTAVIEHSCANTEQLPELQANSIAQLSAARKLKSDHNAFSAMLGNIQGGLLERPRSDGGPAGIIAQAGTDRRELAPASTSKKPLGDLMLKVLLARVKRPAPNTGSAPIPVAKASNTIGRPKSTPGSRRFGKPKNRKF